MKRDKNLRESAILILMLIAIVLGIASFKWLPEWCLLVSLIIAICAIKLDTIELKPYVISTIDVTNQNSKWVDGLFYSWSKKWLYFIYLYEIEVLKNYPIMYRINDFDKFTQQDKEKLINKYYKTTN